MSLPVIRLYEQTWFSYWAKLGYTIKANPLRKRRPQIPSLQFCTATQYMKFYTPAEENRRSPNRSHEMTRVKFLNFGRDFRPILCLSTLCWIVRSGQMPLDLPGLTVGQKSTFTRHTSCPWQGPSDFIRDVIFICGDIPGSKLIAKWEG